MKLEWICIGYKNLAKGKNELFIKVKLTLSLLSWKRMLSCQTN